jgi:hypothetical protein
VPTCRTRHPQSLEDRVATDERLAATTGEAGAGTASRGTPRTDGNPISVADHGLPPLLRSVLRRKTSTPRRYGNVIPSFMTRSSCCGLHRSSSLPAPAPPPSPPPPACSQDAPSPVPPPLRLGMSVDVLHDGAWWTFKLVSVTGPPEAIAAAAIGRPADGSSCSAAATAAAASGVLLHGQLAAGADRISVPLERSRAPASWNPRTCVWSTATGPPSGGWQGRAAMGGGRSGSLFPGGGRRGLMQRCRGGMAGAG